jgi:hypothetical protein
MGEITFDGLAQTLADFQIASGVRMHSIRQIFCIALPEQVEPRQIEEVPISGGFFLRHRLLEKAPDLHERETIALGVALAP